MLRQIIGVILIILGLYSGWMTVIRGFYNPLLVVNYSIWPNSWTIDSGHLRFYAQFPEGRLFFVDLSTLQAETVGVFRDGDYGSTSTPPTFQERQQLIADYRIQERFGHVVEWSWAPDNRKIAFVTSSDDSSSEDFIVVDVLGGHVIYHANKRKLLKEHYAGSFNPATTTITAVFSIFGGALLVSTNIRSRYRPPLYSGILILTCTCYMSAVVIYRLSVFQS